MLTMCSCTIYSSLMHAESDDVPVVSCQVISDNVDFKQKPTHFSLSSVGKDHHYFTLFGVKNRVHGEDLSSEQASADVAKLPLSTWIPSVNDCVLLRKEFTVLIARIIVARHLKSSQHSFRSTYPTNTPKKCGPFNLCIISMNYHCYCCNHYYQYVVM